MTPTNYSVPANAQGVRPIAPTDVAQFIRLEQCERYLRLRLHEHAANRQFLRDFGVAPQALPPLLTRAGATFEAQVEQSITGTVASINLAADAGDAAARVDDNTRLIALAQQLPAGHVLVLFQPRLQVALAGWLLRGDVDILRLERDADGQLRALITDIKSSRSAKVEHRLQVTFYYEMLAALFQQERVDCTDISMAILYHGPEGATLGMQPQEQAALEAQRAAAEAWFGVSAGYLDLVTDVNGYRGAVRDLVTGPESTAARVASAAFETLPFHLTAKCDGCLYNEFCLKWSAERDDLSLLPHLTVNDKSALLRAGVRTTRELALLRGDEEMKRLENGESAAAAPTPHPAYRALAATWPVGPRLDELVERARRYRKFKGDPIEALSYIPSKGYGSLPYCDAQQNPNLVRVYIDAQHDYLHDRIYMLGALVTGCEGGQERPERRRSIVHLTSGPPETLEAERDLLLRWIFETVRAIAEVAAPDDEGQPRAPIHLIFYDSAEQRLLLQGLARHMTAILGATPLYDFVTQLAAFDSPVATFLDGEMRELKNYPMLCQSLQAVAAFLRFDWNAGQPYREIFRTRLFDFWGKLATADSPWYTNRARFSSQIPLEYAYAAWGALAPAPTKGKDDSAPYRKVTIDLLRGFHARRLEALEHITHDFAGNRQTEKRTFDLPDLAAFSQKAHTLAQALDEFVTIERHVAINAWKTARLAPPERRVLSGDTLLVRYREADQDPAVVAQNRDHQQRQQLREQYVTAFKATFPAAERVTLTKEQRAATTWTSEGLLVRLRLETDGLDCGLDEVIGLATLHEGDTVVILPRTTVDSRLPVAAQALFTPTPKQMLYGTRGALGALQVQRDGVGKAVAAFVEVTLRPSRGGSWSGGFVFGSMEQPFRADEVYTLDEDPNDWYGYFCSRITAALCASLPDMPTGNTLYDYLARPHSLPLSWAERGDEGLGNIDSTGRSPLSAQERGLGVRSGQQRFLDGLDALHAAGLFHDFEPSKREYIGEHGDTPLLLVQGPPGTGKSYATAFALFARLQDALTADREFRVVLSCKTHAATDVLLQNVLAVKQQLTQLAARHPALFAAHLDRRLLDVPLYRLRPRSSPPDGVIPLPHRNDLPKGTPSPVETISRQRYCIVAATPAAVYGSITERWDKKLFGHAVADCLVLDEASQMNLPEAIMAALLLKPAGCLIVVGDHRQMPPIVQHDWNNELRRTFQEYRAYESLFLTLLPLPLPIIRFAESFRLHAAMAEFLRREIYVQDGIPYFSRRHDELPPFTHPDPFVAAVLSPQHPIVVVVHDEAQSQVRNPFEQALMTPVLLALADPGSYRLNPMDGLGVVVPHRAQRAALREGIPCLSLTDPATGTITTSAVDTVERFQGSERTAILVTATESDREYLLASSQFLLDPRRLTVALSRAKRKMILVAAQSVFSLFSADEETFAHAQLWKNLLRHTCTVPLWSGTRGGHRVTVWGDQAPPPSPIEQEVASAVRGN
ncbi:MAG: AAA domain-containing protein [Chloroflexota bacterium]